MDAKSARHRIDASISSTVNLLHSRYIELRICMDEWWFRSTIVVSNQCNLGWSRRSIGTRIARVFSGCFATTISHLLV